MPREGTRRVASDDRGAHRKTSDLLSADRPGYLIQRFKESGKADGADREDSNAPCASLRTEVSARLHEFLQGFRIPTAFVRRAGDGCCLIRRTEVIPLTLRVRNSARGAFARRFGLPEGMELPLPVLEYYHAGGGSEPGLVNEAHAHAVLGIAPEVLRAMNRLASKANAVLRSLLERRGLELVSLDLEFGLEAGRVVLASELSLRVLHCVELSPVRGSARDPFEASGPAAHGAFLRRVFLEGAA